MREGFLVFIVFTILDYSFPDFFTAKENIFSIAIKKCLQINL